MQILSIQIDKPIIRAALIIEKKGVFEIRGLKSALYSNPSDVKHLYNKKFKGLITTAISGKDLFVNPLELQIGTTRHLDKALAFQSEASSYFPLEETLQVPYITKKEKNRVEALLFTTSQRAIRELLGELGSLDLEPEKIGAWPLSLARYISWKIPNLRDAYVVDVGSSQTSIVWIENGELKKNLTVERGVDSLLSTYWEDQKNILLSNELESIAKQVNVKRLFPEEHPAFFRAIIEMRSDVTKAITSFARKGGPKPLIFTGRVDAFKNFRDFLKEDISEAILSEESQSLPSEELKYAIAIGSALETRLQFRQKQFFPNKTLKRLGKGAVGLILLSLFLATSLYVLGMRIVQEKEQSLLASLKESLTSFDSSLKQTSNDPEELLTSWSKSVQQYAKEYPFIPPIPTATEVLDWLYQVPELFGSSLEEEAPSLQYFHYELVEYPHIGAMQEPYRVKIEIAFNTKNPMTARAFHDFLLKEKKWIDSEEEIGWEVENDRYRATFFMKRRSVDV